MVKYLFSGLRVEGSSPFKVNSCGVVELFNGKEG